MKQILITITLLLSIHFTNAYTVTELTATVKSGQVFLTWKNPDATNLKYKIYRSSTKITTTSQLTDAAYLGYVKDNSAKNIRKSKLQGSGFYFTIDPANGPLASDRGLYVATCSDNKRHFYAVMVVDLNTGIEEKTISLGSNSLATNIKEKKEQPLPVLQATINENNGDTNYEYAFWGNNQDVIGFPAFNNCGSYAYNFTFVNRNAGTAGPLYYKFQDDDPFAQVGSDMCDDCNVLVLDDWIPNGNNTYWVGFNTNYDMYVDNNPVQTSGIIRAYTQNRITEIIDWANTNVSVDASRVYASGFSHNGFGVLLTTQLNPDKIAAAQVNSPPILIKAVNGTDRENQWCDNKLNLKSDRVDPNTGDTLRIWDLLDMRTMLRVNYNKSTPYLLGVNGKKDVTVGWVQKYHWFDSLNATRHGGVWFWDQRDHTGNGKQFSIDETTLDYLRFSTKKSYPAFAYCSANQNPGNGNANDGDDYGAINGYLDWDDNSISDQICSFAIKCLVKDFYVGGVLDATQYDSCTADITIRRLQKFKPTIGQTVSWNVMNFAGKIVQQGSFTYAGSSVTIYGAKIYKSGSTISLSINNCFGKEEQVSLPASPEFYFSKTNSGYNITVSTNVAEQLEWNLFDAEGRKTESRTIPLSAGENTFEVKMNHGVNVLELKSKTFSHNEKLFF